MRTIAVCFYHKEPTDEIKKYVLDKLSVYGTCTVFNDTTSDRFNSLYNVALKKRDFEITIGTEFNICVAIDGETSRFLIDHMFIVDNIEIDRCYYISGSRARTYRAVNIDIRIFYGNSLAFDLMCDCYLNVPRIRQDLIGRPLLHGHLFYFHIKSIMLTTECINFENRSLFIGAA